MTIGSSETIQPIQVLPLQSSFIPLASLLSSVFARVMAMEALWWLCGWWRIGIKLTRTSFRSSVDGPSSVWKPSVRQSSVDGQWSRRTTWEPVWLWHPHSWFRRLDRLGPLLGLAALEVPSQGKLHRLAEDEFRKVVVAGARPFSVVAVSPVPCFSFTIGATLVARLKLVQGQGEHSADNVLEVVVVVIVLVRLVRLGRAPLTTSASTSATVTTSTVWAVTVPRRAGHFEVAIDGRQVDARMEIDLKILMEIKSKTKRTKTIRKE